MYQIQKTVEELNAIYQVGTMCCGLADFLWLGLGQQQHQRCPAHQFRR